MKAWRLPRRQRHHRAFLLLMAVFYLHHHVSSAWITRLPRPATSSLLRLSKKPQQSAPSVQSLYFAKKATQQRTVSSSSDEDEDEDVTSSLSSTSMSPSTTSIIWSVILGTALLLLPLQLEASTPSAFSLRPAHAQERTVASNKAMDEAATRPTSSVALRLPTLITAAAVEETSILDEVWSLVDKYYVDRSFNGQDWKQVRMKYQPKFDKSTNDEQQLKVVSEMVQTLGDKYSRILDPASYAAIQRFDLIGVGVTLMPNESKDIIVGAPPVAGSAADKAGLKSGDLVTAINGRSTEGRTAFDIIDQISEKPNAETVTMTIVSKDRDLSREVTMERTFQKVSNPVRYKMSEERDDGTKVGFIRILEFNSLIKAKLEEALSNLEAAGANAYVFDLRHNTGGAFQSAVETSSLFVQDRIATYVVDNTETRLPFKTIKGSLAIDPEDPIVIWLDGRSASASEVFAGSLHDNCRAILMGSKSFGKGLIQAVYGLKSGAGLVLTVARYVTPSGQEIQGKGLQPDIQGSVPPLIPGLSTDTSKVDFSEVQHRLDPSMCQVPSQS